MKKEILIQKNVIKRNLLALTAMLSFVALVLMHPFYFALSATSALTYPASSVTKTSAVLNGYVTSGNNISDVWFEFGISSGGLDKRTQQISVFNNEPFKISIAGLEEGTRYFYRVVAVNKDGISSGGTDTFITTGNTASSPSNNNNTQINSGSFNFPVGIRSTAAPFVITNFPENVTSTSAKLKGQALPSGNFATVVWFEWGTDKDFLTLKTPERNVGSTSIIENFEETLSGLSPNTFYYYRAVIKNQNGEGRGDMIRMKTLPLVLPTTGSVNTVNPAPTVPSAPAPKAVPKTEPKKEDNAEQVASVLKFGKFFPNTLIEWLALIALLTAIIVLGDHLYGEREKRKEELKKKVVPITA